MSNAMLGHLASDDIGFKVGVLAEDFVDAVFGSILEVKRPV